MSQSNVIVIDSEQQFANILKSSKLVIADFFADWCGPCNQIAPIYETLAKSLSRPNIVTFVKINSDTNKKLAKDHAISALPTILLFRDGSLSDKVQGANPVELRRVVQKLVAQADSLVSNAGAWSGADVPQGYTDLTDQVEIRGCELLNADESAGPVKTLLDESRPSALNKDASDASAKDWVQSGADDQLLLFVPFQSSVKLHTLHLTSLPPKDQDSISRPQVIHLYINRTQNLDFGEADDTEPTQVITLNQEDWNADGTATINLRYVKFQKTTTLIVYVQKGSDGADSVRLDRLKLIGEAGAKREMGRLLKTPDGE